MNARSLTLENHRTAECFPCAKFKNFSACARLIALGAIRLCDSARTMASAICSISCGVGSAHGGHPLGLAGSAMRDSAPTRCTRYVILPTMAPPYAEGSGTAPPLSPHGRRGCHGPSRGCPASPSCGARCRAYPSTPGATCTVHPEQPCKSRSLEHMYVVTQKIIVVVPCRAYGRGLWLLLYGHQGRHR